MSKYWVIGTSAKKYVNKFIELIKKGIEAGERVSLYEQEGKYYLIDEAQNKIINLKSKSTSSQYMTAWEGLGFIKKNREQWVVLVEFKTFKQLTDYSKLYLLLESSDERVLRYRKTILINTLVASNAINQYDLELKGVWKKGGEIDIAYIRKLLSEYEEELVKDASFIKEVVKNDK